MNATFNGSGDVELYDGDYNQNSWLGQTNCEDGYNFINGNCDIFRVRYDTENMAGHSYSHWQHLACHELGHTAGLDHRTSDDDGANTTKSCMRDDIWPIQFDLHDLDAINETV